MSTYGWEMRKLLAQRRTYIGWVSAVLIPAAFAIGLAINPAKPPAPGQPIDPDVYISLAYNTSGLVLPLIALFFSSLVLVPLLCALVAGDIVAAEDGNQTLKTVLTRSTSRWQLLRAKLLAAATYVLVLLVCFGVSGTLIGILAQGAAPVPLGGVPLGSPPEPAGCSVPAVGAAGRVTTLVTVCVRVGAGCGGGAGAGAGGGGAVVVAGLVVAAGLAATRATALWWAFGAAR